MFDRILHLLRKEFLELRRDRWVLFRLLVPSIIQMVIFGYAATFEVFHVSTAVLDLDHSQESRDLLSRFAFTGRFDTVAIARTQADAEAAIDRGEATIALVVPPGFAGLLRKGQVAPLQVLVDGTNSNTALVALGYVNQIASQFSSDYVGDLQRRTAAGLALRPVTIALEPRPWYNESLNSRWFFVPGLIATLLQIIIVNLSAFAIVREREIGTLEQIMVTPIRPVEFILGKTVPFFLIGLLQAALIAAVGIAWFRVPFVGDPLILLLGTCIFLLCALSLGLLISTVCRTQQQAFATNFFILNPLFILSGFSFPIAAMPEVLQWLTYVNPLRYFLVIIRATFLKGVGLEVLWPELLALALIATVLMTVSVMRFRKTLE
jgi:ABC-2 type transport system permease protein